MPFCAKSELPSDGEESWQQEMQLLRRTVEDGFSKQLTILNDLRIQGIHREPRLQRPTFAHSNTETEVTMHHWDVPQHLEGDVRPSLFSQNAVSINHSIFKSDIVSVDDSAEVLEPEVAMAPDPSVGWMATLSPNPASALEVPLEEDEGNQVDATQSSQLKRYFKKKRDSSRHSFVRRALGAHQERANKEASRLAKLRAKTDAKTNPKSAWRMKLDEITSSNAFSNAIMLVIMVNVVLLGVEVDVSTQLGQNDVPRWFGSVNTVIVAIFCVEIVVKCVSQGLQEYWCGTEAAWNIMDAVIIVVSLVETAIDIWAQAMASDNGSVTSSSQLRLVRSIRLARALRGVRVVRLFRYVSALRTLALCIVSTVGSLLWTLVLLVLLFYTFGVLLTQLVTDHCRDRNILEQEDANATPSCPKEFYYWRTVPDSMLTLFMSIAGGLSWEDALTPLRGVSALAVIFMVIFIVITVFAVLNVVTGVFCNTAIESANADKDIAVIKQLQKQASHVKALRKIFEEIDADSLDVVSIQDLEEAMSQKKLSSFLESMGISTEDVWTLFMIMDNDQTGLVNLEEFVSGCLQGQGPAKSIQLVKMSYENKVTRQALKKVGIEIRGVMTDLSDLRLRMGLQASILPQTGRDSFSMGANSGAEVPTSAGNL